MTTSKENNVNFDRLAAQLTPTALRLPVWNALMRAVMAPFRRLGADHAAFRASKRLRMAHNGQTRLLERVANLLTVDGYDPAAPAIRIDEPDPVGDFLIAPDGEWTQQGGVHLDRTAADHWAYLNGPETPENTGVLHDGGDRAGSLGFVVRLAPRLSGNAPHNVTREAFRRNGGEPALRGVIDTYKLAGSRYTVVQD